MRPDERLAAACAAEAAGEDLEVVLFWGHQPDRDGRTGRGCLSQWWPAPITLDGITYPTAEHWMMAGKARLFGDEEGLGAVLAATSPGAAKAAGRLVRGFDEEVWAAARYDIVLAGTVARFTHHPALAGPEPARVRPDGRPRPARGAWIRQLNHRAGPEPSEERTT